MLVATHLLADLAQVCDSVAVLRDGRLVSVTPIDVALGREGAAASGSVSRCWARPRRWSARCARRGCVAEGDGELSFLYEGDSDGLAGVLDRLVGRARG